MELIMTKENIQNSTRKQILRVAAYCRVSTGLEEQKTSLRTQIEAYKSMISTHSDWICSGIYFDEGTSGTRAVHREGFLKMIEDCKNGKIDYIITKSISRFARNTLECLTYIRQLKEMNVGVFFEENGLNTNSEASELVLSILAAVAQEESRVISTNVKWSWEKRFQAGKAKWSPTYGYKKEGNQYFVIDHKTAPIVRRIYIEYYHGKSLLKIGKELEQDEIPSPGKGKKWWPKVLAEILKNEKYIGDALFQKSYTTDHITHHRVKNLNSEAATNYYVKNHHKAIIPRKLFHDVQVISSLKDTHFGAVQYPYATFLICPFCQKPMARNSLPEHGRPGIWRCSENCSCYYLYESCIDKAFLTAFALFPEKASKENKKVEYYLLSENIISITFPYKNKNDLWKTMEVHWKNGEKTCVDLNYKRERDFPGSTAQINSHPELPWSKKITTSNVQSQICPERSCYYNISCKYNK